MKKELAGCVASSDLNLEAVEIGRRLNSRSHTEKEVAEFIADLTEFEKECDKRHVTTSILEQKQPDLLLRQKQIEALERQIEIDSIAL